MDYEVFVSGDKVTVPGLIDTPIAREDALRLAETIRSMLTTKTSRWSAEEDEKVRRLYEQGEQVAAIAEVLGRTVRATFNRVSLLGLSSRRPDVSKMMRAMRAAKAAAE